MATHGQVAARLAVDTAALAIDKPYDYIVPPRLAGSVRPGARVLVPFGRGNRVRGAVVLALTEPEPGVKLKTILALLDESPVLDEKELKMALWLRERCFCTLFEAVKAILPHGLWFQLKETWRLTGRQGKQRGGRQVDPANKAARYTVRKRRTGHGGAAARRHRRKRPRYGSERT